MIAKTLAVLSLAAIIRAQTIPATASAADLALVKAQYDASGFAANDATGFGIELNPQALVEVVYPSGIVQNGQALTKDQVATLPTIYITPSSSAASTFGASSTFTITLADAAALGNADPQGDYRHYLVNGVKGAAPTSGNLTFPVSGGTVVTSYAGPGPNAGEGPHRYAWLVFAQPSTFSPPANLSTAGVAPGHWDLNSYVSTSKLGNLVGASFFTVQNGQPTYAVPATASINPATLAVSSAASSAAGSGSVAASGPTSAGPSSASASSNRNNAGSMSASPSSAVVAGVGMAVMGMMLGAGVLA